MLLQPRSLAYFGITLGLMLSLRFFMPVLLRKLREFEADCEKWDETHSPKILPDKERAVDDESADADRPDRTLMDILYGLPKESI